MISPIKVAIAPAIKPMVRDVAVPCISCAKTSRPKLSVPNQAVAEGGSYRPPIVNVGSVRPVMTGPRKPNPATSRKTTRQKKNRPLNASLGKRVRRFERKVGAAEVLTCACESVAILPPTFPLSSQHECVDQ